MFEPGPVFTFAMLLDIIWYIALFFVPFLIMAMNGKMKRMEKTSEQMLDLALTQANDASLSQGLLMRKYGIRTDGFDLYFVHHRSFKTLDAALHFAKTGEALEEPANVDATGYSGI